MAAFDTAVPVLLLRLDRNPFHHGTLGAVRSLGRWGVEVHLLLDGAEAGGGPVAKSRYLQAVHRRATSEVTPEALLVSLNRVHERIGRPAVLIAMDDLSAITVARLAPRLSGRFICPPQEDDLPAKVADKATLALLCEQWGIPHPETVVPSSVEEAASATRRLGLPVVAKWSRPWLLPAGVGLRSTTVVRTSAEARALYARSSEAGSRLLLQRFVPGDQDTDRFFHGCFGAGGRPLLTGSGRKALSWPLGAGLTAVGRWQPDPQVQAAGERLAGHLGYRGILDLDFRRDEANGGVYRLLDFNPRPGAQFRLFTDVHGLDVVRALYLDLTGQPVPAQAGGPGRVFVAENYALLAALASTGRTGLTRLSDDRPSWRTSRPETAWFSADDALPFLSMVSAFLGRGAHKGAQRILGAMSTGPSRGSRPAVRAPRQRGGAPSVGAVGDGQDQSERATPAAR
ncbi:ATP-grasp domain-containing protein [Streptomyces sp. NPDC006879]|uniref:carboxylate--amine ligase n=1 Tax=Streptomyces sp. NPDC006879 TaxID=3364767 RepID=UPI0036996C67